MAKGDVTLKFDAQTAAFVQAIATAREKLDATADSARKMGDEVAKAGDKAESAMHKAGEGARELAIKMTGVASTGQLIEKAFELGAEAVEKYFERIEKRAEVTREKITTVSEAMARAGQQASTPAAQAALEEITSVGGLQVNPKERDEIFSSITQQMGLKTPWQVNKKATEAALLARANNLDLETSKQFGVNYATLSMERREGGSLQYATDEEIEKRANELTLGHPGGLSDRERRFFFGMRNKDTAIKALTAASLSEQSSRGLLSVMNASDETITDQEAAELRKKAHHRTREGAEAQRRLRIYAMQQAGDDVAGAMLTDPSLAPPADQAMIGKLQAAMQNAPTITPPGWMSRILRGSSSESQKQLDRIKNNSAVIQGMKEKAGDEVFDKAERFRLYIEKFKLEHPNQSDMFGELGFIGDEAMRQHKPIGWVDSAYLKVSSYERARRAGLSAGLSSDDAMGIADQAQKNPGLDVLKEIAQHLEDLKRHAADQTATLRNRSDATHSNNSEGQK